MSLLALLRDKVRTLFGIRKPRRVAGAVEKPAAGAKIIKGDLRMTVQVGLSDDLWDWLVDRGWREATYNPDRRRYHDFPPAWVAALHEAGETERAETLAGGEAAARREM